MSRHHLDYTINNMTILGVILIWTCTYIQPHMLIVVKYVLHRNKVVKKVQSSIINSNHYFKWRKRLKNRLHILKLPQNNFEIVIWTRSKPDESQNYKYRFNDLLINIKSRVHNATTFLKLYLGKILFTFGFKLSMN